MEETRKAPRERRSRLVTGGGVAAALVALIGVGGWRSAEVRATGAQAQTAQASPAPAAPGVTAPTISYANVVDRVAPAVVTIRTERKARVMPTSGQALPPELRQFFGRDFDGPQQRGPEHALGSGVIVSADGYLLTNNHVIDEAQTIRVELPDRRVFDATLVGADPASDLAVLKIKAEHLPVLALGDSDRVRVGDVVLAVGNPLGVGQTVTMGIISAKGRQTSVGDGSFENFLQTDAPINQGNSGGALVNLKGELVGINSQIISPSGGNIGVGFAIPANMAHNVMGQLIETGTVHRARLGVTAQSVSGDIAASLGLDRVTGALVSAVDPDSPAARAGIEQGDLILEVNGQPVADSNALRNAISSMQPGSTATLTLRRSGATRTVTATLGELQPSRAAREGGERDQAESGRFGMRVQPMTPDLADELNVPAGTRGLAIVDLDPSGAAAEAGLQVGDVITRVNGQAVQSADQLRTALDQATERPALLLVQRQDHTLFLTLRAPRTS